MMRMETRAETDELTLMDLEERKLFDEAPEDLHDEFLTK